MMTPLGISLLAGTSHPALARAISDMLEVSLTRAHVGRFPDGEIDVKIQEDVRGRDVFILQPTCPPVNDALMELMILIDCVRRASASRITAVIPYFGYARKDRKDEGRVPITAKVVANMLTVAGLDRVLTMDLHAAQIQGFFDVPVDHLYAKPVLTDYFRSHDPDRTVVVAPDAGGIKMARAYANTLGVRMAIVDKRRMGPDQVASEHLIGEVEGMDVILVDDMISTGGTICDAARMVDGKGASRVSITATHGLFCEPAIQRLADAPVDQVVVTDSVRPREEFPDKIKVLSVAPLLSEAIRRIHHAESVSSLFID